MSPQPALHWFNSKSFQLTIKVVAFLELMHPSQQNIVHVVIEHWLKQFEIIEFDTKSENYLTILEEWIDSIDIVSDEILDIFDQISVKLDIVSTLATRKNSKESVIIMIKNNK